TRLSHTSNKTRNIFARTGSLKPAQSERHKREIPMRLLIVSGRSGSGKSSALHLLEDEGFTCMDNLPVNLLHPLLEQIRLQSSNERQKFAIGIDARNLNSDLSKLPELLEVKSLPDVSCKIIYLDSSREVLLKRFSETRRKHPLSDDKTG